MDANSNSKPPVLILEDEALIALDLHDQLRGAGYKVAGPFTTCAAALSWLETATPATAILDTALKDGSCHEIALELTRREVPFLIYSGYHEDRQLLAEFPHLTWIEKPAPSSVLVEACQQLLVTSHTVINKG
jgi:DNA-binding response OmpR family regulator